MKRFLTDLDAALSELAVEFANEQRPERHAAPAEQPARGRSRPLLPTWTPSLPKLGLGFAVAASAFVIAGLVSDQTGKSLPIFDTASASADTRQLAESFPPGIRALIDFDEARGFQTPAGTGFAVHTRKNDTTCLALPNGDLASDDSYSTACGTTATVLRDGLVISNGTNNGDPQTARTTAAVILPIGVTSASVTVGDTSSTLRATAGIASLNVATDATLSWTTQTGAARSEPLHPVSDLSERSTICPGGTTLDSPGGQRRACP